MFANWQLVTISLSYIGLLFFIAYTGDKYRHKLAKRWQPIIYALTLGVYCTSWSFLGTTGQASSNFLSHLPIYLGPILLFIFAWPLIQRIIRVSLKLNLTSIADLLAARFGKSHKLAIMVTCVALVATMPYLALQLKAIVYSFEQLQVQQSIASWKFGLIVSLCLAGFTIIFGIRHLDVTERHPGVMLAIAFESLVKVTSFLAVGIFVTFFLFDSPMELWRVTDANIKLDSQFTLPNLASLFALLIIVMAAFLALPRQFQVMVVELQDEKHTELSRKLFPIYILAFAIFAIPLGLAGHHLLGDQVPSDTYVLFLPDYGNQQWLSLLAFLGAISAASSMVIISAIALSTMLSNEIVFPLIYRMRTTHADINYDDFRVKLLNIRKALVLVVILLGYSVFLMASPDTLSSLGEVAFGAFAQLTPALIAAFYWRRASLTGVYSGILIGFLLWLILSFLPQFGLYASPLNESMGSVNTIVTIISLSANIFVIYIISQMSRQSVQERVQASIFLEWRSPTISSVQKKKYVDAKELELLVSRFVGEEKAQVSFALFIHECTADGIKGARFNQLLLEHTENTLASVMGASSARLVLSSALEGRDIALDELALLVEEASSQKQQFSQNLLQSAIENASEGISIIDSDLNLVAWNSKYLDLFDYPESLIYSGAPVATLITYNVKRGVCGPGDIEEQVHRRIQFLRQGSSHQSERELDGKVIRIEGNPLPDGGFVMLFSDITAYKQAEQLLKAENVDLEALVNERTEKLALANRELTQARKNAEQAHTKKSLYLKACSHDLMQPLEAARLFAEALSYQGSLTDNQHRQVNNISHSLKVASDLLDELGEIARIESGNIKPQFESFLLDDLLGRLAEEFSASAENSQIEFRIARTNYWIYSDQQLLHRMLQNLIGNAFRYASPGRVFVGARKDGDEISIQVLDNGPGIDESKQAMVFEQFTQLNNEQTLSTKGLGLGLNITQGLSQLLGHKLSLKSQKGHGCKFMINVGQVEEKAKPITQVTHDRTTLNGLSVLCVDDDEDVLSGMVELLSTWGCDVIAAESFESALEVFEQHKYSIDVVLSDYQLSPERNGIELIGRLRQSVSYYLPAILITATTEANIEQKALDADLGYMRKMVKPGALRALINAQITKKLHSKLIG
ncbi:hybrid sensor histidine kinase/response regulator [Thalassotalea atypica]|uniref:hybrid sensor histidine kinase/response regulator n=1 Tax=Thalassotalea atypica TaxID=2054316 RepID=UPI0025734848|nr:PAS domain-containing hybrid sensor histidine kinase/response regulator [Thalassotalea atypica]